MFEIIYFQVNNITNLCQTIATTTRNTTHDPSLEAEVDVIKNRFETILTQFSRCHSKYNSSEAVEDTDIDVLGKTLSQFTVLHISLSQFFFLFISHYEFVLHVPCQQKKT